MSESRCPLPHATSASFEDLTDRDEAAEVQDALRALLQRSTHPLLRACLEQCLEDIAHLTSCD